MRRFGTWTRWFALTVRTTTVITLPLALMRRIWIFATFFGEWIFTIRTRPLFFATSCTETIEAEAFAAGTFDAALLFFRGSEVTFVVPVVVEPVVVEPVVEPVVVEPVVVVPPVPPHGPGVLAGAPEM